MIQYEDFSIRIESKREDRYPVRVLRSPAGEAGAEFEPTFNLDELGPLLADLGQTVRGTGLRDAARAVTPGTQPRELGHQLYSALFSGSVRSLLDSSRGMLHGKERGLRIKLHINPDDPSLAPLASLPWELLYRKETRDFLSLSHSTPVVRYLDIQRPYTPLAMEPPLRILVVVSCPAGHQKLDLDKERELIEWSWAQHADVEVEFMEKATIRALQDRLGGRGVHVLHFMGHGDFDERSGHGVLLMEDSEGNGDLVDGHALGVLLRDARTLRLVVLNACETARVTTRQGLDPFAGIATALVLAGIPAVVAMQFPISDGAAITFAERFYPLLAKGRPVDYAMTEARKAIYVAEPGTLEWATPVLFMRSPQGVIFEVREAQPPQVTPVSPPAPPFESHLQPQRIAEGEAGRVTVQNLGDRAETLQLTWQDPAQDLVFDPAQTELSVPQGQSASVPFRAAPRRRRWIGGEKAHPFTAQVTSAAKETQTHSGKVVTKGLVPIWVLPVVIAALVLLSLFLYVLVAWTPGGPSAVATQTAEAATAQASTQTAESSMVAAAQAATRTAEAVTTATAKATAQTAEVAMTATVEAARAATAEATAQTAEAAMAATADAQTAEAARAATAEATAQTAEAAMAATQTAEATMTALANILYARPEGLSSGECNSWDSACGLQYALSLAEAGSRDEIWVAAGTYKPTTSRDRFATFQLVNGVEVYGGFAGTETSREARDWVAYETILSGDIGAERDSSDNSYHVVTGSYTDDSAVLDGFAITGGNAETFNGGGMVNKAGSPTLANLILSDNVAAAGGGMGNTMDSNPTLINCTFRNNTATGDGGGMHNWSSSEPKLTNITFVGNYAYQDGGGMANGKSHPKLTNVTFSGNVASRYGGGIYSFDGIPKLYNCILWDNEAEAGDQIYRTLKATYSDIQDGCDAKAIPPDGADCGAGNINADPLFVDAAAGDLRLRADSPAVDAGNKEYVIPVEVDLDGNPRIVNDQVDMGAYEFQGDD